MTTLENEWLDVLREAATDVILQAHRTEMAAHLVAAAPSGPHMASARHMATRLAAMDRLMPIIDDATTVPEVASLLSEIAFRAISAIDDANIPMGAESFESAGVTGFALNDVLDAERTLTLANNLARALQLTTVAFQSLVASEYSVGATNRSPNSWVVYWAVLKAGVRILPEESRHCFLEDWMSALPELDSRWSRASFILSLLTAGIPRMAWTLRRPESWGGSI
jgi:hypothetical protein